MGHAWCISVPQVVSRESVGSCTHWIRTLQQQKRPLLSSYSCSTMVCQLGARAGRVQQKRVQKQFECTEFGPNRMPGLPGLYLARFKAFPLFDEKSRWECEAKELSAPKISHLPKCAQSVVAVTNIRRFPTILEFHRVYLSENRRA